jgi:hypothetical protein
LVRGLVSGMTNQWWFIEGGRNCMTMKVRSDSKTQWKGIYTVWSTAKMP